VPPLALVLAPLPASLLLLTLLVMLVLVLVLEGGPLVVLTRPKPCALVGSSSAAPTSAARLVLLMGDALLGVALLLGAEVCAGGEALLRGCSARAAWGVLASAAPLLLLLLLLISAVDEMVLWVGAGVPLVCTAGEGW
jgi:hypothetical protein